MNGKAILVTVLTLKPGFDELLVPELAPLIEAGRQITECLVFDLYRLSQERSTLVLHEVWNSRDSLEAFALSPLRTEMTVLMTRFLSQPPRTWKVEEIG
ncbi:MAG: putative quinol monooxygenase [Terracidiphilus sp.]|jgi:quinol monooxygenase YgiN